MNTPESNETLLEAEIVHRAHMIDKTLAASPERRDYLLSEHASPLEGLLKEWVVRGYKTNSRISWAREIIEELKTGRKMEVTNEEKYLSGDVMALLRSRRSVRSWTDEPVGDDIIGRLLEAARWAPSSGNRQSVRLVVLRSEECKGAVCQLKESFFRRASVIILVGVDLRVYKPDELRGLPYLDTAAAIQNMLLAAHAGGLGCVWGKLCVEDWETCPTLYFDMKRRLNLPGSFYPVSVIAVGWRSKPTRTPPRHEVDKFVRFEDKGFSPDDYPEWRPDYWRLYWNRVRRKIVKMVRGFRKGRTR